MEEISILSPYSPEVAARTGTAVVYERDGKLVREYPTLDELRAAAGVCDLPRDGELPNDQRE